ncbi:MAG: protein kinase [Thermoguttaceae bacterium]
MPPAELPDPRSDLRLPLDALRGIDLLCERFERALQANPSAIAEDYLAELAGDSFAESALLRELLALELEYRLRRGEFPAAEACLRRFPAHAEVVALVFEEIRGGLPQPVPEFLVDHPRYRVLRRLGSGGMGTVYCAEHRVLQRAVALKIINPELLADAGSVDRFVREARAAACLNHPNVVAVYDAETAGGGHFLVMEYVVGTDLAQLVLRQGPLPVPLACDYIRQAALGLQHACEHGMVHRDITPRNLMLTEHGQVKVLDFGLAYFVSEARTADRLGAADVLLGSVDYMAPEQSVDPHATDIRADIYGMGCTLFFLLTGQPPFPGGTLSEKLQAHAQRAPPAVGDIRAGVPPALSLVLSRMLSKSPGNRYQTPLEVAFALSPFSQGGGPAAVRRPLASGRRAWIAVAVSVVLCGFVLSRWWPVDHPSPAGPGEPTEAQRLYREGLLLVGQRQEPQMRFAIQRLQGAVQADAGFAPAYTALADAYNLCGDYGWGMADDVFPKAEGAARKALALDEHLAEAHLALAVALEAYDCDWTHAEAEYRWALALNPQLPAAHHWYAWFLAQLGRWDEATSHIEQAQRLGPDEVIIANNVGKIYYLRRRYAVAVNKHKYALELNPDFRKAHRDLGLAYAEMGKLAEALAELDRAKGLTEDGRDLLGARAYAYARNGHAEESRRLLAQLEPLAREKPLAYEIAAVYAALGEKDSAFAWLQRAFGEHSAGRSGIAVDPRLDGLRPDPRFKALLNRMGLADHAGGAPAPGRRT